MTMYSSQRLVFFVFVFVHVYRQTPQYSCSVCFLPQVPFGSHQEPLRKGKICIKPVDESMNSGSRCKEKRYLTSFPVNGFQASMSLDFDEVDGGDNELDGGD